MLEAIWDIITSNPYVLLILLPWLLGTVFDAVGKAAQRAQQQRREKPPERESLGPVGEEQQQPTRSLQTEPTPQPSRRQRPSAEEIAAEMRRIMGQEAPQSSAPASDRRRPVVIEEPDDNPWDDAWQDPQRPSEPQVQPLPVAPVIKETLQDRMQRQGEERLASAGPFREMEHLHSRLESTRSDREPVATRQRRLRRRVDLSDPAAAVIMMEILGPPKGLR